MFISDKMKNALGNDTIEELESMNLAELQKVIVDASTAMKQVKDELEANPKYQELKADKSAAEAGKRDVNKRQGAKIKYAIERLGEIGKLAPMERITFERDLQAKRDALELKKAKEKAAAAKSKDKKAS